MSYFPELTNGLTPDNSAGQGASVISNGLPNLASPPILKGNKVYTTDGTTVTADASTYNLPLTESPEQDTTIPYVQVPVFSFGVTDRSPDGGYISYAGTNIQAILEIGDNPSGNARFAKQLVELTTISISIHRAHAPASALGFIGAKGYARGRRTVAGTMVFTQFTQDVLAEFLNSNLINSDVSADTTYTKVDQLPLFNLTLLFTSEYGYMSYRRLYGIDFVTDGTVYSSNDMMTEQTISYVASDFTPLKQLDQPTNWQSITSNPLVSGSFKTPGSVISAQPSVGSGLVAAPIFNGSGTQIASSILGGRFK
jgi:hypothetical protein